MIPNMESSITDPTTIRGQDLVPVGRRILVTLLEATAQRIAAEHSLAEFSSRAKAPEDRDHLAHLEQLRVERDAALEALTAKQSTGRESAKARSKRHLTKIDNHERAAVEELTQKFEEQLGEIDRVHEDTSWTADAIYENLAPRPRADFEVTRAAIERCVQDVDQIVEQLDRLLRRASMTHRGESLDVLASESRTLDDHRAILENQGTLARTTLERLRKESMALIMRNWLAHLGSTLLLLSATALLIGVAFGWSHATALSTLAVAVVPILLLQAAIWTAAGRRLIRFATTTAQIQASVRTAATGGLEAARAIRQQQEAGFRSGHLSERAALDGAAAPKRNEVRESARARAQVIRATAQRDRRNASAQAESADEAIGLALTRECEALHAQYDRAVESQQTRHAGRMREIAAVEAARDEALRSAWKIAREQMRVDTQSVMHCDHQLFPSWSDPMWVRFRGQTQSIGAAKIGAIAVAMHAIPGALPSDPDLAWPAGSPRVLHLPITLAFPAQASLLVETDQVGRAAGIALLQETILRILTSLPPGRARFTIIDPVGLGEPFAAFMHLTDEAPHVIGERIWTDTRHIEQRLVALCEHMETVIQKFLRNEFEDIDAYNAQAGEIAEPYRFLVLADFPTGLSDIAARRLASIVTSGARCGVFTIILRDTRQPVPPEIDIAEIRNRSLCIHSRDERLVMSTPPFGDFPFTPGSVPESESTIALLRRIGATAKSAMRVEVPFSAIAPADDGIWKESAAHSITVALGRAGAMRLQQITLGIGTSQHALIAGKTGSGKSTLFHALITNLALRYSPDEAELWLVDFKKGVEFRTYATNRLPHARAVAVESDREFGLSVLRGLDVELRRRGELFRDRSVQDLAGYRRLGASEIIPRTLLIVDEFQELFTEDDRVSEESALLLDRLVRQGRAFGIHVILGSQTLGGAYSIARATMGQMAVRIALQCTEADSQLILSDDNVAARLLSRPGEAIYNDAGGLVEGNNPFQVVWLSDEERDRMLAKIRTRAAASPPSKRPPMIIFEGSAAALLSGNPLMHAARCARDQRPFEGTPLLWFGDAISIKDPTAVALRRQTGTNIMLVGQREDAALGVSAGALVSMAAQFQSGACAVHLLDGTPPDAAEFGQLAALKVRLGLAGASGSLRDCETVLAEVIAELATRQNDHTTLAPAHLVLVHATHRFRSLRRNEDDFGYGSSGDTPQTADRMLATILREGPQVGIHVMVTCDGSTNLARTFDRNSIREFEWRLLFQVSASDSSTLIDSPVASRLGPQRALLHSEESGTQEKFRPYAWPDRNWLDEFISPK
ncbi:MAG: cell division protein FtsK [Phycisphaerales bacterium]|nr:cell division protein FtsK [Phycisphaerales bacterium]